MTTATRTPAGAAERSQADSAAEFPVVGELRLNLSALGIDPNAPDFAERFFRMACENEPYTLEFSANGDLIVMAPTGPESNEGEQGINFGLFGWGLNNPGRTYSQTVQFQLPSGAVYIPDAAWITQERFDAYRSGERTSAIPGAPDFVVEVRSRTDRVPDGLAKMQEWMDGGARLGWYIDPYDRRVYVYRAGREVEVLEDPETLSGEGVLTGFVFEVKRLVFDRYTDLVNGGNRT